MYDPQKAFVYLTGVIAMTVLLLGGAGTVQAARLDPGVTEAM